MAGACSPTGADAARRAGAGHPGPRWRAVHLRRALHLEVRVAAGVPQDRDRDAADLHGLDCLWADGRDLREQALRDRRERLEKMLAGQNVLLLARRLADNGLKAWAQVVERGYEVLVAKDPASPYPGRRTLAWLKVKVPHYREGKRGWEARPTDRG